MRVAFQWFNEISPTPFNGPAKWTSSRNSSRLSWYRAARAILRKSAFFLRLSIRPAHRRRVAPQWKKMGKRKRALAVSFSFDHVFSLAAATINRWFRRNRVARVEASVKSNHEDHQLVAPEIKTWLYCIDLATFIGLTLNPCLFSVKRIQPGTNYNISSTSRIVFVFSSKCHVRIRNVWYKIKSKPLNRITAVRDRSGGQMPPFNWSSPAMRCSAIESPSTHTPQKKRKKLPTSRPRDRRRGRWAISSRPRRHWRPSERRKWWRPRRWWRRGW